MATFDRPVTLRRSLALYTSLLMALFYLGNAMPDTAVHVKVAPLTPTLEDGSLPDQLSLVIQDDSGWETDVLLNRVEYLEPNIPVYTNGGGHKGGSDFQLAELEDNQNVAYYQSPDHEAAIQVTQVDSSVHQFDFLVSGELVVNGTRCSLTHGDEAKRDLSSSSDLVYTLHELPTLPEGFDVVLPAPEPDQREFEPHASRMPSEFSPSGRHSETLLSRNRKRGTTDVFVDLVAVADFARYNASHKRFGSETQALEDIREHYTSVINRVDAIYQASTGLPYSIHIRLFKLYVDVTPASGWWSTEQQLRGDKYQLDASPALGYFMNSAVTEENPFLPYEHLVIFTGYDMAYVDRRIDSVIGFASMRSVCSKSSITIVEDRNNNPGLAVFAAHELGHSLSAEHDGDGNACDSKPDTMAGSMNSENSRFSSCSVAYFNNFINGKLQTRQGRECLLEQLPARSRRSSP